ncbi:hypothetical protein EB118_02660 [bacterium]|nr:hypothetical protein [bacterium]
MNAGDSLRITANIVIFAIMYTFAGAGLSYVMYYLFDVFGEEWKRKSFSFKMTDIFVEVSMIAVSAFWVNRLFNEYIPIIPVRSTLVEFVNTYTVGLFFMFTIFLFLSDLTEKLTYIHDYFLEDYFDYLFPAEGSILDFSLRYSKEQRKKFAKQNKN